MQKQTPTDDTPFESIFLNENLRSAFREYCAQYKVEELLSFLDTVNMYQRKPTPLALTTIVETYIVKNDLRINPKTRDHIIDNMHNVDCLLFKASFDEIAQRLKDGHFLKFKKTKYYEKYKKGQASLGFSDDRNNTEDLSVLLQYADFSKPFVTDSDFDIIYNSLQENDNIWKLASSNGKDVQTFTSKKSVKKDNSKGLKCLRIVGYLPYSALDVLHLLTDAKNRLIFESHMNLLEQIDYVAPTLEHPYATSVTREGFKGTWPVQARDLVVCNSVRYDGKRYIWLRKSVKHAKAPVEKNYIRAMTYGGYMIEPITASSCKYLQFGYVDLGGWLPAAIWNASIIARGNEFQKRALKILGENKKSFNSVPKPKDSLGVIQTLDDNVQFSLKYDEFSLMMNDDLQKKHFSDFLKAAKVVESLMFADDTSEYQEKPSLEHAKLIWHKYFDESSIHQINISSKVKEQVTQAYAKAPEGKDIFQAAQDEILLQLKEEQYVKFKKSASYQAYKQERMSKNIVIGDNSDSSEDSSPMPSPILNVNE